MQTAVATQIVAKLLELVSEEEAKMFIDGLLDQIEDYVSDSPNPIDDGLLPAISLARRIMSIPDDIGGDED